MMTELETKHTWTGIESVSSTLATEESPEDVVCIKIYKESKCKY